MNYDITIALPVYKRTDYMKSALDSAVNQTVKCSILIIDNNSPHDEFEKLAKSYKQVEIKYVRNEKTVDVEDNFNLCFQHAETPWVTILHDDDMLHCQYVEFSQQILHQNDGNIGGLMYQTNVGEEEWSDVGVMKALSPNQKKINPAYFHFYTTPFPGVLVKRSEAIRIGGFQKCHNPNADIVFWHRYSLDNPLILVEQQMAYFRVSSGQLSGSVAERMLNDTYLFRLNQIQSSSHNNFLAKLGLEFARINNLAYYEETYDNFELPESLPNKNSFERANRLYKSRIWRSMVRRYISYLSFSRA